MIKNGWTEKVEQLERENAELKATVKLLIDENKTKQEMVTKFSSEGDEYQKRLDEIDLWAMEVQQLLRNTQEYIKKIRGKI